MINPKNYLKGMTVAQAKQLKKLRATIEKTKLPPRNVDQNLLIATFNIREFGEKPRESFAINALAEIISSFDIVAIQELRSNLSDLKRLMDVLGPYWKVIFNDPAGAKKNKGNDERLAYIYDGRILKFTGMAAELLISDYFFGNDDGRTVPWRTPYMVSFRAGTFDFMMLTVHIQWNKKGGIKARTKEIAMIAKWIKERSDKSKLYDQDIFILGDFNIPSLGSQTFKALIDNGLEIPEELHEIKTNLKKSKHYDQIAYFKENTNCSIISAGIIDFYDTFFKGLTDDYDDMTYQISDHLPLYAEIRINETDLDQMIKNGDLL